MTKKVESQPIGENLPVGDPPIETPPAPKLKDGAIEVPEDATRDTSAPTVASAIYRKGYRSGHADGFKEGWERAMANFKSNIPAPEPPKDPEPKKTGLFGWT